jgi:predicted enzyme related to lactoylglutathione lyase
MRRFLALAALAALLPWAAIASPLGPEGEPGRRLPGKFVWFDLATEDPASARDFYHAVFGWNFLEITGAAGTYALITNESGKVGGMLRHARPAGAPVGARWLSLIAVPDVEQAVERARERGGSMLVAPHRLPGRGTHAVLRDPQGAIFGLLAAEGGDPADTPVEEGDIFWLDLFTPDPAQAAAFYEAVAGFHTDEGEVAGRPRTLLSSQGIARAGIARMEPGKARPQWLPYILVQDIPATLERARRAGGSVVVPPRADVLEGNVAVISDPQGGSLGIVKWASDAPAPAAPR